MTPTFFRTAADFRRWLEENHTVARELWVGFYKKASGKPGLTYPEAVDEALCFGWIDGVMHGIDRESFRQRFTPRRLGSNWSNVNVGHVQRLTAAGKMHAAGLAAFTARTAAKTGVYSFERETPAQLPADFEQKFRAHEKAWAFFRAQSPWYQRTATHKVISPKQASTRERWLALLIADSAAGRRLSVLTPLTPAAGSAKSRPAPDGSGAPKGEPQGAQKRGPKPASPRLTKRKSAPAPTAPHRPSERAAVIPKAPRNAR